MTQIFLKSGREKSVLRKHPWIFSGAIQRIEGNPQEGEVVKILSKSGMTLGCGHFQQGSIQVRICRFDEGPLDQEFWNQRIQQAFSYRTNWVLPPTRKTNCFRLIHAEGDQCPGLIIDIYGSAAVIQCHSIGMHMQRRLISQALQSITGITLTTIYCKSKSSLPANYGSTIEDEFLVGERSSQVVLEYGHQFFVDWISGQKTGFFLDQRENRNILSSYASGKKILNTFCYSGGFSVYALKAGASFVQSVDVSSKAIEWTEHNISLNHTGDNHKERSLDVHTFLKEDNEQYDIVIVDPPAFAKNLRKRHNAIIGYKNLNEKAIKKVSPGGLLFTFSCSQVVDEKLFKDTIIASCHEAGRQGRIMHRLSQPSDHPVNLFHPEGAYLKGLVLQLA